VKAQRTISPLTTISPLAAFGWLLAAIGWYCRDTLLRESANELDHAAASGRLATADLAAFAASSIAAITKLVAV
jgi:hypothetical protein